MPTAWTGTSGRFGVHLFEGKVAVLDMDRLESMGAQWHRKNTGNTVEMVIIFPSDARMTSEERVRMAKLIKRWEDARIASATIILADGILGAMQRSVLTGLMLLAPPPHPAKVFGNSAEGVTWLAPHVQTVCGAEATRALMQTAVDAFCSEFKARADR